MTTDEARRLRDRILTAAAELIEERGVDRVRVEDVAERAGVESVVIAVRFPDLPALVAAMVAQFHEEFPSVLCRFAGYEEPMRPRKRDRKKSGRRMVLQGRPLRSTGSRPGSISEALALLIAHRGAPVRVALATPDLAWLRTSAGVAAQVREQPRPPTTSDPPALATLVRPAGAPPEPESARTMLSEPPPQ